MSEKSVRILVDLDNHAIPSDQVLALSLKESGGCKHGPGDDNVAIEDLNAANATDPENADILYERGKMNAIMEKYEEALIDFDKAHTLKPCCVDVLGWRAETKLKLHDFGGALQDLNTTHQLDPNAPWVLRLQSKVKYYQDNMEGAIHDLNRDSMLEPHNADTFRFRGIAKLYQSDYKASLKDLDKSNELEPNNSRTLWHRARTKLWLGDHDGALLDLNKANEIESNDVPILLLRAEVKEMSGDLEGCLQDVNVAYELDPHNTPTLRSRSFARYLLKDRQGSVRDMDMALELDPTNVFTLRGQARLKHMMGDYDGALQALNKACQLKPDYVTVLIARATVKHLLNDIQGSLHDLDTAHDLEPQNIFILKERVVLKVMKKDYQGALIDLAKAHHLDPDDFTRGMRKALRQHSKHYLNAMASLLAMVLHNVTENVYLRSYWGSIVGSFEDLSSRMSFLLEVTKTILQIWTCYYVIVIFTFKYLMGYVERGQWGTYSNGSWEFRATYVCIELRLGAYPFQKFRDVAPTSHHDRTQISQPTRHLSIARPQSFQQQSGGSFMPILPPGERTKYCGVYRRNCNGKQGPRTMYEPRESSKRDNLKRIYLGEYHTLEEAVLIRDVAHFCLGKQGPFNVDPVLYENLDPIPQGHSQQQIRKFVLERAKEVDSLAFKEKLEIQEMMAGYGVPPTLHHLHSNQQASQDDDVHLGHDDIGEFHSPSSEDFVFFEPPPVPEVSSQPEITAFAQVLITNNPSSPNESLDLHATTERTVVTHPTCANFQSNDQNLVHSHENTRAQDVGVVGNTPYRTNLPFFGPTSSSNEVWTRQIVIQAPVGTTLLQHSGTRELVYSPTLIRALSALEIFGVENWTLVPPCAFSGHSRVVCPDMSNGGEGTPESCQYSFRIQKSGSPEELAISDSIRAALDKFRDVTGWTPWY